MFLAHCLLSYVIFLVTSRDLLAIVIRITDCYGRKNLLRKIWRIILTHFWPTFMIVKNFQTILQNFALVNTNKSSKNNISYLLKRLGISVFQEVRNISFYVQNKIQNIKIFNHYENTGQEQLKSK